MRNWFFSPLKNHVPNLHDNVKTNMAAIVNKAYYFSTSVAGNPYQSLSISARDGARGRQQLLP